MTGSGLHHQVQGLLCSCSFMKDQACAVCCLRTRLSCLQPSSHFGMRLLRHLHTLPARYCHMCACRTECQHASFASSLYKWLHGCCMFCICRYALSAITISSALKVLSLHCQQICKTSLSSKHDLPFMSDQHLCRQMRSLLGKHWPRS